MWRLVFRSKGTVSLEEIRTSWRFVDVMKANVVLNAIEEAEARAAKAAANAVDNG